MLTQLLVEVLVTIFFVLALAALPTKEAPSPRPAQRPIRWGRVVLSAAAGVGAAAWVAALAGSRGQTDSHVADFVRQEAPAIAQGSNLVNVVLTDVRSLDTLMETLVVVLGTLGVVGLVKGIERADQGRLVRGERPADHGGLLPGLAKAIVPIGAIFALTMLIKGHNAPGGGFVAGLSLGVTAMIALAAFGPLRFVRRLRVSASTVAILGCVVMLLSGGLAAYGGDPYLTQLHGKVAVGALVVPLHSTLIFDLGVMLAVAGGITAAGLALWTMPRRALPGELP
jgi:multisubunit Na+/H+ antiporter MnhB subunit